jgi:hypothetical protein
VEHHKERVESAMFKEVGRAIVEQAKDAGLTLDQVNIIIIIIIIKCLLFIHIM